MRTVTHFVAHLLRRQARDFRPEVLSVVASFLLTGTAAWADLMEFRIVSNGGNCVGCAWIRADGEIVLETPDLFLRFLAEEVYPDYPEPSNIFSVRLNSIGGNLGAGVRLGEIIREHGFSTSVERSEKMKGMDFFLAADGGVCLSSCFFAFIGGESRGGGGEFGVHQVSTSRDLEIGLSRTQELIGEILLYVVRMGVDPNVLLPMVDTAPDKMYLFTDEEKDDLNITTYALKDTEWRLEPYKSGLVPTSRIDVKEGHSEHLTLFCRTGGEVEALHTIDWPEKVRSVEGAEELIDALHDMIILEGDFYHLPRADIATARADRGRVFRPFDLPFPVEESAEMTMTLSYSSQFRLRNALFSFNLEQPRWTMPPVDWFVAIENNCIR